MLQAYSQLVKRKYENSQGDSVRLFRTILSISRAVPVDEALACLEQCVTEKRSAWLDKHTAILTRTGNPLIDGFTAFYIGYLGLAVPRDGEIVEITGSRMVMRWWNHCPTLEACRKLGLDTRHICQRVYEQPVQVFLSKLDPCLRFGRNYAALRPHTPYCEEIISLESNGKPGRGEIADASPAFSRFSLASKPLYAIIAPLDIGKRKISRNE